MSDERTVPLITEHGVTRIPVSAELMTKLDQMRGEPVEVTVADGATGETVHQGTWYMHREPGCDMYIPEPRDPERSARILRQAAEWYGITPDPDAPRPQAL